MYKDRIPIFINMCCNVKYMQIKAKRRQSKMSAVENFFSQALSARSKGEGPSPGEGINSC